MSTNIADIDDRLSTYGDYRQLKTQHPTIKDCKQMPKRNKRGDKLAGVPLSQATAA